MPSKSTLPDLKPDPTGPLVISQARTYSSYEITAFGALDLLRLNNKVFKEFLAAGTDYAPEFQGPFVSHYLDVFLEELGDSLGVYEPQDSRLWTDINPSSGTATVVTPTATTEEALSDLILNFTLRLPDYEAASKVLFVTDKRDTIHAIGPNSKSPFVFQSAWMYNLDLPGIIALADIPLWAAYIDIETGEAFSLKPVTKAVYNRLVKRYNEQVTRAHKFALADAISIVDELVFEAEAPKPPILLTFTATSGLSKEEVWTLYNESSGKAVL